MLSQITIAGRSTKDPIMQTKGDTKYVVLDIAQTQGFGDDAHSLFFNCYFNSYLAERLLKAKVQKGTCLDITGRFDSKEFTRKDGTLGRSLEIRVHDWDFSISNKSDTQSSATANVPPPPNAPAGQMPPNNMGQGPSGGYHPGAASYQGNIQQGAANAYMTPPNGQSYIPPVQSTQPPQQGAVGFHSVPQTYAGQLPFPA